MTESITQEEQRVHGATGKLKNKGLAQLTLSELHDLQHANAESMNYVRCTSYTVDSVFPHIITQCPVGTVDSFETVDAAFHHRHKISPFYANARRAYNEFDDYRNSEAVCADVNIPAAAVKPAPNTVNPSIYAPRTALNRTTRAATSPAEC